MPIPRNCICLMCGDWTGTLRNFERHFDEYHRHPKLQLQCPYPSCSYIGTNWPTFQQHLGGVRGPKNAKKRGWKPPKSTCKKYNAKSSYSPTLPEKPDYSDAKWKYVDKIKETDNKAENLSLVPSISFIQKDAQTIVPGHWMNDEAINLYIKLICERNRVAGSNLPKVYGFLTFFYPKFKAGGYGNVRKWTKRDNIFAMDILLFPIHASNHWTLAVADLRTRTITYYDSYIKYGIPSCVNDLVDYLEQELMDKLKKTLIRSQWTLKQASVPQQSNNNDCGAFLCKFAEYISRDAPLNFDPDLMNQYRYRMFYEVTKGGLVNP